MLGVASRQRGRSSFVEFLLHVFTHWMMVIIMLGLVGTMIPIGPALKSLADGNLAKVSGNLTVAFSIVIIALIAASLTYWIANVRRRWLAEEMLEIQTARGIQ